MTLRIGLLECDHVAERFRHIDGDYRDMFAALLDRAAGDDVDVDLVPYDAIGGEPLPDIDACDAWMATGSRHSVYDELPWIDELARFVRDVGHAGAPYAGICFGHQLLAHALGGRTAKATMGWGAGAHDTVMIEQAAWMDPPLDTACLLYMHQDQVLDLPPRARVVGRTDHCPKAAIVVDDRMLGVQAHPEFTAAYVDALVEARRERLGVDVSDAAQESLERVADGKDADIVARWILTFLRTRP